MQGRQGERREMILAYIDRASRRLTKQKAEKTIQLNEDFCGGRKERPASAAKAYWSMLSKRDAGLTKREHKKTVQRSGDDGWEAPPVPIPNTAVKLPRVESTGLEAAWEDRLLPVIQKPPQKTAGAFYCLLRWNIPLPSF